MSKVKIEGHGTGTGTFTVTTPSSNTDRTITLPDFTGTLLTSTVRTATNEGDAILIEQSDGTDVGSLRINNGSFLLKGKHSSNPVQIQTHDGNEDIEVDPDGFIKFETGGSERMRLTDNGLTFNGDTAAANALDDYEEGTWTPTITVGTASAASGVYTRVGRLVQCNATLTFPSQSSSTVTQLGGLPFTAATYSHGYAGVIRYTDFSAGQLMITVNSADTIFGLYDVIYGSSTTQTTYTEMSGKRLDFSITYNAN